MRGETRNVRRVRALVHRCDTDERLRDGMRSEIMLHGVSQNRRLFLRPRPLEDKLSKRFFDRKIPNRLFLQQKFNYYIKLYFS